MSRIWTSGPTVDQFDNAGSTGATLYGLAAHPALMNPSSLLAISPGGSAVYRVAPGTGMPVNTYGITGTSGGACYVNVPPLKPHYFLSGKYASGSAHEFFVADSNSVEEIFVRLGTGFEPTHCAFVKSTVGPGTPFYRWFWTDKQTSGSTGDTIYSIDFRDADVQVTSAGGTPWNPAPNITTYGPPFPKFSTQIGGTGPTGVTWANKFFSQGFAGNDDDSHRLAAWTDAAGANYLILGRSEFIPGIPEKWKASFTMYNADNATFPLPEVRTWDHDTTTGIPDVFQDMKVTGNYLFATTATNSPAGKGGKTLRAWWLPGIVAGAAADAARGIWTFDGCTGIWSNFLRDKVYVGGDDSHNQYAVCPVNPASVALTVDATPGLALLGISTYLALTIAEQDLVTPPDRKFCGLDGIAPREDPNSFPGTNFGQGSGRRSKGGACSGAVLADEGGGQIGAIALMLVLVGLAGLTLKFAD